jgi:quinol-cytochrome oxidoreductase complex cytochrome b subunit
MMSIVLGLVIIVLLMRHTWLMMPSKGVNVAQHPRTRLFYVCSFGAIIALKEFAEHEMVIGVVYAVLLLALLLCYPSKNKGPECS